MLTAPGMVKRLCTHMVQHLRGFAPTADSIAALRRTGHVCTLAASCQTGRMARLRGFCQAALYAPPYFNTWGCDVDIDIDRDIDSNQDDGCEAGAHA